MSEDSHANYVNAVQRRAKRIALVIGVLLVLILAPLIVSGDLRLSLAWELGMAPGPGVERVADGNSGQTLIVIPVQAVAYGARPEIRYRATYLVTPVNGGQRFTNLVSDATFDVPAPSMDFLAADDSGLHLLITSGGGSQSRRWLVDTGTDTVDELPHDQSEPDLEGNWQRSIWATRIGRTCSGISPMQQYVFCFRSPTFAKYLAGDWQIDVQRYGQYQQNRAIFRGAGTQPVAGFTADDRWLYFQNERGIWREPISPEMFD